MPACSISFFHVSYATDLIPWDRPKLTFFPLKPHRSSRQWVSTLQNRNMKYTAQPSACCEGKWDRVDWWDTCLSSGWYKAGCLWFSVFKLPLALCSWGKKSRFYSCCLWSISSNLRENKTKQKNRVVKHFKAAKCCSFFSDLVDFYFCIIYFFFVDFVFDFLMKNLAKQKEVRKLKQSSESFYIVCLQICNLKYLKYVAET